MEMLLRERRVTKEVGKERDGWLRERRVDTLIGNKIKFSIIYKEIQGAKSYTKL
jgi:hypothetical protein